MLIDSRCRETLNALKDDKSEVDGDDAPKKELSGTVLLLDNRLSTTVFAGIALVGGMSLAWLCLCACWTLSNVLNLYLLVCVSGDRWFTAAKGV